MAERRSLRAAVALAVALAGAALLSPNIACGPDFPNRYLAMRDDQALALPRWTFASALDVCLPKAAGSIAGLTGGPFLYSSETDDSAVRRDAQVSVASRREFDLYQSGADLYRHGEIAAACESWRLLLELPPEQRPFRSVWAAYMLGRALEETDVATAVGWYQQVRDLTAGGFRDTIGLALASIGREGRIEFRRANHLRAVQLYCEQFLGGDPSAVMSLRMVMDQMSRPGVIKPGDLDAFARNHHGRAVLTAYLATCGSGSEFGEIPDDSDSADRKSLDNDWLEALARNEVHSVPYADMLAWIAYQDGRYDEAGRWANIAGAASANAQWVRAKLMLREGRVDEAADLMAWVVQRIGSKDEAWVADTWPWRRDLRIDIARGQAGAMLVASRRYLEAIDLFLASCHWGDAAHVAERLLTVDELIAFVRSATLNPCETADEDPIDGLRHLLARRLARIGRYQEALEYMPEELFTDDGVLAARAEFARFVSSVARGRDSGVEKPERAAALFAAARIARKHGLELFGTEIGPDVAEYDGNFDDFTSPYGVLAPLRGTDWNETAGPPDPPELVLAPTEDELERFYGSAPIPNRRFHYRFFAAELGWEAASFMPDNDGRTARVLWESGSWIKVDDPRLADRFYKALVNRCRKTPLGGEADRKRWFPRELPVAAQVDSDY